MNQYDKVHHVIRLVQVETLVTILVRDYVAIYKLIPCQLYGSCCQTNKNHQLTLQVSQQQ